MTRVALRVLPTAAASLCSGDGVNKWGRRVVGCSCPTRLVGANAPWLLEDQRSTARQGR
jgi:hypothetical protein